MTIKITKTPRTITTITTLTMAKAACLLAVVLAHVLTHVPAFAQSASQSANQPASRLQNVSTATVTVTAMRQPENILTTPLSLTVVPRSLYVNSRGFGLDEALSLVPGVLVQSRTGNQDVRVLIRGFGARGAGERSNAGTSRGIRVYVDGIPETEPDGRTAFDLIDLAGTSSIEVVRSNASALWGNAAGGVLALSTIPDVATPFLAAQAQFGSFGFQKHSLRGQIVTSNDASGNGAGQVGQAGQNRVYFSVNNTMFDGWRAQSRSLLTQFNIGWIVGLGARTTLKTFLAGASNNFQIPGPLNQTQFDENPQQAQGNTAIYSPSYVQRNERRYNRLGRIGTTLEHAIDDNTSLSAMAFLGSKYLQRSERNTFRDFNRYHTGGNLLLRNKTMLNEASGLSLKTLVGSDVQYQDGAILFYNLVNGQRGTTLRDNKREGALNVGAFAQAELGFGDLLSVVAGARYDNITYYNDNYINPKLNEQRAFERVTPKFGLTYRLAPLTTLFANMGGGVEVPAGNETDPPAVAGEDTVRSINSLLKPIESTTFEAGIKHVAFAADETGQTPEYGLQRLTLDAAAFLVSVANDIVPYRGGRFYMTVGRSQRFGAELGAQANIGTAAGAVDLFLAATYMQSRFVEYRLDSGLVDARLAGRVANYDGNKQPGIPDIFGSLRARYTPAFLPSLALELEGRHTGSYFADDLNTLSAPAATVLDATLSLRQPVLASDGRERLFINAFLRANNLTNAKYVASVWINPDRPATLLPAYIEPGLPFALTGSLGVEWRF
jgi:iron complex outermembrane recepter protein